MTRANLVLHSKFAPIRFSLADIVEHSLYNHKKHLHLFITLSEREREREREREIFELQLWFLCNHPFLQIEERKSQSLRIYQRRQKSHKLNKFLRRSKAEGTKSIFDIEQHLETPLHLEWQRCLEVVRYFWSNMMSKLVQVCSSQITIV